MARGIAPRVGVNMLAIIIFTVGMIALSVLTFASGLFFDDTYQVRTTIPDAGGILPRQQVTVMGRAVGTISASQLTENGVELTFDVEPQFRVPATADVKVLRRSPIGEQAVELTPVPAQGWAAVERGGTVDVNESAPPPTVEKLLDTTVQLFEEVSPENTATIIHELGTALDGRADVLRQLNDVSLDVGGTILDGQDEFRRLLDSSEPLLTELDDHADDLVDLFRNNAELAEVLADNRPDIERLLDLAPNLLGEAEALVINIRPDAQCLVDDLIAVNDMLLGPSTADGAPTRFYDSKLDEVQMAIDKHQYFFQLGIPFVIGEDPDTGMPWVRVKFMLDHLSSGDRYPEYRPTPPTRPGAACETAEWGTGVNAVRQADAQPVDPTSPGILYAPLVEEDGPSAQGPGGSPSSGSQADGRPPTPATGGGMAMFAVAATLGALLVNRRR